VTLGQNLGQMVQVRSGIAAGDRLVNNPPAGLLEAQSVQPVTPVPGYATASPRKSEQPEPPPIPGPASADGRAVTP
jgi:hypothetical protein